MTSINITRLAKDIKNILRDPIENIYYKHDEENILKGYALIIGPKDTPYQYGYYFFEFTFPDNYPFLPPKVKYYTNDGHTRFNPNFYVCGKVCLSLLNTWKGDGWTSCQNIRSILVTLQSTLNNTPLCNEPGLNEKHKDYNSYNNMIKYKNIEVAVLGMLLKKFLDKKFIHFFDIIVENYKKNHSYILEDINNLKSQLKDSSIQKFSVYASEYLVNFKYLEKLVKNIDKDIVNLNIN